MAKKNGPVLRGEYAATCAAQRCGFFHTPLDPQQLVHVADIERSFRAGDGLFQVMPDAVLRGRRRGLELIQPDVPQKTKESLVENLWHGIPESSFWDLFVQCLLCKDVLLREGMMASHKCKCGQDKDALRHHPYGQSSRRKKLIPCLETCPADVPETRPWHALPSSASTEVVPDSTEDAENPELASGFRSLGARESGLRLGDVFAHYLFILSTIYSSHTSDVSFSLGTAHWSPIKWKLEWPPSVASQAYVLLANTPRAFRVEPASSTLQGDHRVVSFAVNRQAQGYSVEFESTSHTNAKCGKRHGAWSRHKKRNENSRKIGLGDWERLVVRRSEGEIFAEPWPPTLEYGPGPLSTLKGSGAGVEGLSQTTDLCLTSVLMFQGGPLYESKSAPFARMRVVKILRRLGGRGKEGGLSTAAVAGVLAFRGLLKEHQVYLTGACGTYGQIHEVQHSRGMAPKTEFREIVNCVVLISVGYIVSLLSPFFVEIDGTPQPVPDCAMKATRSGS
ncbi:hypothetical protein FA13DRAFT_1723346 [Coprinellus micaceus]|uniref:Uncharacterized protein n=1 Tax=Coprinellus micaceus TaxID=71717 RepID=A0A4Y7R5V1_COPMI|nr:hypothetical protein FA13DRAFT_1723346 [Coprinellus micaceus]